MNATVSIQKPKTGYGKRILVTDQGPVVIHGPVEEKILQSMVLDQGLNHFRTPEKQHHALCQIASLPKGEVYIAAQANKIIAYVAIHPPEFERWKNTGISNLYELGAIEISWNWRRQGIASALLQTVFSNTEMEDRIVISLECTHFWDLHRTGLTPLQYSRIMQRLFSSVGFMVKGTDDPEVREHPVNMMMVRYGSRVCDEEKRSFEQLCYLHRCPVC